MPAPRLIPQEISSQLRVLILPSDSLLAREIKKQLSNLSFIAVVDSPDERPLDVFIALNYSQTSSVHIVAAKKIFIDHRESSSSLSHTAAEIISKFVYNYSPPSEKLFIPPESLPVKMLNSSHAPTKKYFWLIYLLFIPFVPWILIIFQTLFLLAFTYCGLKSYSPACSLSAAKLADFINYQLPASVGAEYVFKSLGYSPNLIVNTLEDFSQVTTNLSQLDKLENQIYTNFISSGINTSQLDSVPFLLNATNDSLSYFQSDLKDFYLNSTHPPKFILSIADQIVKKRTVISHLQIVSSDLKKLLGFEKKLTYLILLQDHSEIRPTGGYLDSFFLATVDSGRLLDIQGYTAKFADSQLSGLVEPPPLFSKITGKNQWYLSESNWDPDVPTSAQKASWFISKEYSRTVDVVLVLNSSTLLRLADTRNYLTNYLAQIKPTNDQNTTSLLNIFQTQLNNFTRTPSSKMIKTIKQILLELESRQIFIIPQTTSVPAISQLGWNGGLLPAVCGVSNCLNDYFYAVDMNLSGNKTDAYISRKQQLSFDLTGTQAKYTYHLTYQNQSPSSAWPAGTHKNFLRLYLPSNIKVDKLLLNTIPVAESNYYQYSEHGLAVVGLLVDTPPQKTSLIELIAHQPLPSTSFHYQLTLPHQPGLASYPLDLAFYYPINWHIVAYRSPSVASVGTLRYNTSISSPEIINFDFSFIK